jgi:hypothetical protein
MQYLNAKARGRVGLDWCRIAQELKQVSTVRELSLEELEALIGEVVEEKLREMLGDPCEGLTLRPDIQERVVKSLNQPKDSRQTVSAAEVAHRLGLDW